MSATVGGEPAMDVLFTPEDRGWVATATAAWQGERLRAEGGLQVAAPTPTGSS